MKIGSLCTGYGGLDMGVHAVIGGELAWFFEYDSDPSKILEYHWPEVPNYGDLTAINWATVAPVDAGGRGGTPAADAERDGRERRRAAGDLAGSPRTSEGEGDQRQRDGDAADDRWRTPGAWGPFAPAINRWERVTGRLAPAPTRPDGRMGGHRLSPEFVEWMMGLPAGHITDVAIKREAQLKALGNGVVPQQAALAVSTLLGHTSLSSFPTEETR